MSINVILGILGSQELIILLVIVVVIVAIKTSKGEAEMAIPANQTNKVVNVNIMGGILGMFLSSPRNALNARIQAENVNGWKVIQVIPADSGNIFLTVFRLILLVCTLFLYTTSNGYYVIMERVASGKQITTGNIPSANEPKCSKCGKEFSVEMKGGFCEECGNKL